MKTLAITLVLTAAVLAGRTRAVTLHLTKAPSTRIDVWVIAVNQDGMHVEYFGTGEKAYLQWADLVAEDAKKLRRKLGADREEDERRGFIRAQEVVFNDGHSVSGIVESKDPIDKLIYVRVGGHVMSYPLDHVARIEQVRIREADVYDPNEIYVRRLKRNPPTNWGDHRRLADYMRDVGNYEKAREHYAEAIRLNPDTRAKLAARIEAIDALIHDGASHKVIRAAKALAHQKGRYDEAVMLLREHSATEMAARRRIAKAIDEILALRARRLAARYHYVKVRAFDRVIEQYLAARRPTLDEAISWMKGPLLHELKQRISQRMPLSEDELGGIEKARGAVHWTSYGAGSFVLDPNAKLGASTGKAIRGDPGSWWRQQSGSNSRAAWMRAYAAERLPGLFEVVRVKFRACEGCGGTGRKRKTSVRRLHAVRGGHHWLELCRRCFGAGRDRAIGYR